MSQYSDNDRACLDLLRSALLDLSEDMAEKLLDIMASDDFQARIIRTTACRRLLVEELYLGILGRKADEAGITVYMDTLLESNLHVVIASLLSSQEYRIVCGNSFDDISAEVLVSAVYKTILDREPDPRGIEIYGNALRHGMTAEALISEFLGMRLASVAVPATVQAFSNLEEALSDLCMTTREMITSRLLAQGCKIKLAAPPRGGDIKMLTARANKLLFTLQALSV